MVGAYNSQIYVDRNGGITPPLNIIGKDKIMRIIMNIQHDHDTIKYSEMSSYVDLDIVRRYPDKPWNYKKIFRRLTEETIDIFNDNYFKLTRITNCKHLTKYIELDLILRTMNQYILYDHDNIINRIHNEKEMELYLYNLPSDAKTMNTILDPNWYNSVSISRKITTEKHIRILLKFGNVLSQLDFLYINPRIISSKFIITYGHITQIDLRHLFYGLTRNEIIKLYNEYKNEPHDTEWYYHGSKEEIDEAKKIDLRVYPEVNESLEYYSDDKKLFHVCQRIIDKRGPAGAYMKLDDIIISVLPIDILEQEYTTIELIKRRHRLQYNMTLTREFIERLNLINEYKGILNELENKREQCAKITEWWRKHQHKSVRNQNAWKIQEWWYRKKGKMRTFKDMKEINNDLYERDK